MIHVRFLDTNLHTVSFPRSVIIVSPLKLKPGGTQGVFLIIATPRRGHSNCMHRENGEDYLDNEGPKTGQNLSIVGR